MPFFIFCCLCYSAEKYDGSLTHIVPTLVTMVDTVPAKLEMVCTPHMAGTLPFQT